MGMAAILDMWPWTFVINLLPLAIRVSMKFEMVSEKTMF